jgi:hypothetical protein
METSMLLTLEKGIGITPKNTTKLWESSGFELCHESKGKGIILHLEYVFGFAAYLAVNGGNLRAEFAPRLVIQRHNRRKIPMVVIG